ncbi:mechanosensitive ion channel family protein [Clostridium sp. FP2]|uniref:mechanosensitive ion channel domain-containing protein n=1 Tax=Clostridium TaxID=1485 RepID=UPI0013E94091|nr:MULTISPECIES: mechanosensitive ion channel domain-containing protein [Clostridium]MBW9157367.1 mechanosensitive ion channel family protein [Clostridium tagluense]MBZ9623507.1 mechanosensitive ion channel family protein [Clostridium sp. FP2]WLC67666.1 mechanosensitive ion channel family protein [Clostridium tagluense]
MAAFLLEIGLKFQTVSVLIRLIITLALIIIFHLVKKGICSFVDKSKFYSKDIIKYKKTTSLFINILSVMVIIPIWMYESKDILTFLGIFSAGLAFAFRDVVASFLGWVIINTQKPFAIGDRIKIGKSLGDVLAVDWFYTTIIEVIENDNKTYGQSTGRITHIPNIILLTEELINETNSFPFTWNEIEINLSLSSNWKKAKEILVTIANDKVGDIEQEAKEALSIASKTLPIYYENLSHTIYTSIEEGRVCLSLRFICKARNFRNLEHAIVEDILDEFSKNEDIELL